VVGTEIEHALRGFGRKHLDRVLGEVAAQVRRDRHDVVARDHQGLAGLGEMRAAPPPHPCKTRPLFPTFLLTPEPALPLPPPPLRDRRGAAPAPPAGIDGHRAAEARAHERDAFGVDRWMLRQPCERVAGILDLLEADHPAELALAVTTAAHAEAQRDIAEDVEHLAGRQHVRGILVAAKAMQHQEGGALLPGFDVVGNAHGGGQAQTGGWNAHVLFGHLRCLLSVRPQSAHSALILVSHESPNRLDWPVRWRTGDRVILGPKSPFRRGGRRPAFHRTRTVAGAATRARLRKEGERWMRSMLGSTYRRTGWMCIGGPAGKLLRSHGTAKAWTRWWNGFGRCRRR